MLQLRRRGMSTLMENVMYLLILAFFVVMISVFLWSRSNSAFLWEDFYTKELARIVSTSQPGDDYRLDVHQGTVIAKRNGLDINEAGSIFRFNAETREVCVKLSKGEGKCHPYISDVVVSDVKMELGVPTNFLKFRISAPTEVQDAEDIK